MDVLRNSLNQKQYLMQITIRDRKNEIGYNY